MGLLVGCDATSQEELNTDRFHPNLKGAKIVLYSGRKKGLVGGIVARFASQTGAKVQVHYGKTSQLLAALKEEGAHSPADVFWAMGTDEVPKRIRARQS